MKYSSENLALLIHESARRSGGSELKLQGEIDGQLRESLKYFDIDYNPIVNKSLSRFDSGRPDSLFGHVVLDYKAPGVLRKASLLVAAKRRTVNEYQSLFAHMMVR